MVNFSPHALFSQALSHIFIIHYSSHNNHLLTFPDLVLCLNRVGQMEPLELSKIVKKFPA